MNWLGIMSFQAPSTFGFINLNSTPTEQQVLCAHAFKSVRDTNIFDHLFFEKVGSFKVKHLHTWCVVVLTAQFCGSSIQV